jgi:hypothetical protein
MRKDERDEQGVSEQSQGQPPIHPLAHKKINQIPITQAKFNNGGLLVSRYYRVQVLFSHALPTLCTILANYLYANKFALNRSLGTYERITQQ